MSCSYKINKIYTENYVIKVYETKLKKVLISEINILKKKKRYIKLCLLEELLKSLVISSNDKDMLYKELYKTEEKITEAKKKLSIN